MAKEFATVTEIAGDDVSQEQIERLCHRYYWAKSYCSDKDVLELACGTGQGLGYLASYASKLAAGDIDTTSVAKARNYYGSRVHIEVMDACATPFPDETFDVILLFEALYYLEDAGRFVCEARRILRPGGQLLVATANRDLQDFNPSPFSVRYHGARELQDLCETHGFNCSLFGYWPYRQAPFRQSILRPVKRLAVSLGLMPKTMQGKKLLKRLVFGRLVPMPFEIRAGQVPFLAPHPISGAHPDTIHRVIYCAATKRA